MKHFQLYFLMFFLYALLVLATFLFLASYTASAQDFDPIEEMVDQMAVNAERNVEWSALALEADEESRALILMAINYTNYITCDYLNKLTRDGYLDSTVDGRESLANCMKKAKRQDGVFRTFLSPELRERIRKESPPLEDR